MNLKNMKLKAFTMAEAILTMTILGIIATIMISTLKPAEYREKGLQILAKKVMGEIDDATTQILINNSRYGKMTELHRSGGTTIFSMAAYPTKNAGYLGDLYKNYVSATRTDCVTTTSECPCGSYQNRFWLKDGACIGINGVSRTNVYTWFPGETTSLSKLPVFGSIFFDINGKDDPNVLGQDQFLMPFTYNGIDYEGSVTSPCDGNTWKTSRDACMACAAFDCSTRANAKYLSYYSCDSDGEGGYRYLCHFEENLYGT